MASPPMLILSPIFFFPTASDSDTASDALRELASTSTRTFAGLAASTIRIAFAMQSLKHSSLALTPASRSSVRTIEMSERRARHAVLLIPASSSVFRVSFKSSRVNEGLVSNISIEQPKPISFPQPSRRASPQEKARLLIEQSRAEPSGPSASPEESRPSAPFQKVTTRLDSSLYHWVGEQARSYRERYPRRPRVTVEEAMNVALDYLKRTGDFDALVEEYRS